MEATNGTHHYNLHLGSGQYDLCREFCKATDNSVASFIRKSVKANEPMMVAVINGAEVLQLLAVTSSGTISMGRGF